MPLRVLIAPDKFKGTLSAAAAAAAMRRGWLAARPGDQVELLPISDGGDGFGEIVAGLLGARPHSLDTVNAAGLPLQASWWLTPDASQAVIEAARINGLALLPRGQFHPFDLDTFGVGQVLRAARATGAKRILLGIGGSATNDGGFGLARALGVRFHTKDGHDIARWTDLAALDHLTWPAPLSAPCEVVVAVDVQNPLLGPLGCTRVYGPQKGLRPEDFARCDAALGRLADVVQSSTGRAHHETPGAGAAGGLGFGLFAFASARPESGFAVFAELAGLPQRLQRTDLVLTAEGALDEQTMMGKGVGELALAARAAGVPCLGFAGIVPHPEKTTPLFRATHALTPGFVSREEAMSRPAEALERLVHQAALAYGSGM